MCLSLAVPALAAGESLTRLGFAKLPLDRPATDQEMEENARRTLEWTEKMQAFFHAPAWLCPYVESLYNKGIIQAVALEDWDTALSSVTALTAPTPLSSAIWARLWTSMRAGARKPASLSKLISLTANKPFTALRCNAGGCSYCKPIPPLAPKPATAFCCSSVLRCLSVH